MTNPQVRDSALPVLEGPADAYARIDGRRMLYFIGTTYLGLQAHAEVVAAACNALQAYGVHGGTLRGGYGTQPPTIALEATAARLLGAEDAFYFASGLFGPETLLDTLAPAARRLYLDEHAHFAIQRAARNLALRMAWPPDSVVAFRHADPQALDQAIRATLRPGEAPLVLSDGLFAVLGDIVPAADYLRVLERYAGGGLLVDDAHALGVLGPRGHGSFEAAGVSAQRCNAVLAGQGEGPALYACATLSKAIGGHGGIVAGSREFIAQAKRSSPLHEYGSPPCGALAAASECGLRLALESSLLRERLAANALRLKRGVALLGLPAPPGPGPIVPLTLGDGANMRRIQQTLWEQDIAVAYLPTYSGVGPEGVLRLAVFATHEAWMIEHLIAALGKAI